MIGFLDTVLITLTGQKLLTLDVTTGKAVTGTTSSEQWRIEKKIGKLSPKMRS